MAQRKENVVMFPFMATSHIIPFIALALRVVIGISLGCFSPGWNESKKKK
jgi:hypothetical protein